jgi:hypothetical protein
MLGSRTTTVIANLASTPDSWVWLPAMSGMFVDHSATRHSFRLHV